MYDNMVNPNLIHQGIGHNKMTMTDDLNAVGFKMWGDKFLGTFAQDKLPLMIYDKKKVKYAILNVDRTGQRGSHWTAISGIPNSNKIMVFDSFGRASKDLLPLLRGGNVIDTDRDAEQKIIEDSCGQYALAWLQFRDKYGLKNAKLI